MYAQSYSVSFPSTLAARAAYDALVLETGQSYEKKAKTRVQVKNNRVTFTSIGKDAPAIKASRSNYTQLAEYLKKMEKGA